MFAISWNQSQNYNYIYSWRTYITTMRRTLQEHAYTTVKENKLLRTILTSTHPVQQMDRQLNNPTSVLLHVADEERIGKIRDFLLMRLEEVSKTLEAKMRNGESIQKQQEVTLQLLTIQRKLQRNSCYKKQLGTGFGPVFLRVLVWSSRMALSEEVLKIISELSFDKSLKLYYYYFKYYMSHLNLFYPDQIEIKNLFICDPAFNFGFTSYSSPYNRRRGNTHPQGQNFIIKIQDIHKYFAEHGLNSVNPFIGASIINKNFNLGLTQENQIFHALMVKIKIVQSIDRNSLVRTVLYANWIFGIIDSDFVQSPKKIIGVPDIFQLPPDYAGILEEIIESFFQPKATPQTHLTMLTFIDSMLILEQKKGARDFYMSLNQNTTALIKMIEALINQLCPQIMVNESEQISQKKQMIPMSTVKNKEVLQKLVYLVCKQIAEATQIHNIAEELANLIFTRKTLVEVTDKTIQYSGQILIAVETDQLQILNFTIQQIKEQKPQCLSYLKILNMFFQKKHVRQRRDLSSISRSIVQSEILPVVSAHVRKQCEQNKLRISSYTYISLKLIGNICSENPSLVDLIAKHQIINIIIQFLGRFQEIDDYQCINFINFLHYVCLKEGEVRNVIISRHLETIFRKLLVSNFHQHINYANFGGMVGSLIKFMSNIPAAILGIYFGTTQALKDLNSEYKQLQNIQKIFLPQLIVTEDQLSLMEKYSILDMKLIIVIKLVEKCKEQFFQRTKVQWLYILYKRLIKLCFVRTYALIDNPGETRMMINIIHDVRSACQKKLKRKLQKESEKKPVDAPQQQEAEQVLQYQVPQINIQNIQRIQQQLQNQEKNDHLCESLQMKHQNSQQDGQDQIGLFESTDLKMKNNGQGKNQEKNQDQSQIRVQAQGNQMKDEYIKQKQNLEAHLKRLKQSSDEVFTSQKQSRNAKQLNFLNHGIKMISKTLKQCFESIHYNPQKIPRKIIDIFSSEQQIIGQVYVQLKISISISKMDRIVYYLVKQLLQESCNDFVYHDIIQMLLPYLINLISQANIDFLNKNLSSLKNISSPVKYTDRGSPKSQISVRKLKVQLNQKSKDKLLFYYGFLIIVMKCIPPLVEKQGIKYVSKLIQNVISPFNVYAKELLQQIKSKKIEEVSFLQVQKLKNIVKMYLELFCVSRKKNIRQDKKHKDYNIYAPTNNVFLYYLLLNNKNDGEDRCDVMDILGQILHVVTELNQIDNKQVLEDNLQNRFLIVKRVEISCILEWVHQFIQECLNFKQQSYQDIQALEQQILANFTLNQDNGPQQANQQIRNSQSNPDKEAQKEKEEEKPIYNILLYLLAKAYRVYSRFRKSLTFQNNNNMQIVNKIKNSIVVKFPRFIYYQSIIKRLLKQSQSTLQIPEQFLANPLFCFNQEQFKYQMQVIFADLAHWIQTNSSTNKLTEKDITFLLKFPSPTPTTQHITDKNTLTLLHCKHQHYKLIQQIFLICKHLFNDYKIKWHIPKSINKEIQKQINRKINIQKINGQIINIKEDVMKLSNIIALFSKELEVVQEFIENDVNDDRFSINFVAELVVFVGEVIGNYQVSEGEDKYRGEANVLARNILDFLIQYFGYYESLQEHKSKLKKEKKKLMRKSKGQIKKTKTQRKRLKRLADEGDNNYRSPTPSKHKQSKKHHQTLKRDRSQLNLKDSSRLETSRPHYRQKNECHRPKSTTDRKPKAKNISTPSKKLSKLIQNLIVNILASSQSEPYLENSTLNEVTDFILKHMQKPERLKKKSEKTKKLDIKLSTQQIMPYLLRVRICNNPHQGYFHKLAAIAFFLVSDTEAKINVEMAIKRTFFQAGLKQMPIKQWNARFEKLVKVEDIHINSLGYLLKIKKSKLAGQQNNKTSNQEKKQATKQQKQQKGQGKKGRIIFKFKLQGQSLQEALRQKKTENQQEILTMNESNYKKYKNDKDAFIMLAPGAELNLINYNLNSHHYDQKHLGTQLINQFSSANKQSIFNKEKDKQRQRDRKRSRSLQHFAQDDSNYVPIKAVDYVPNKHLQIFIHQIINNMMRLIVKNMEEAEERVGISQMNQQNQKQETKVQIFNLSIMGQALVILLKQCACVAPYLTKYKCRKIILQNMEGMSKKAKTILSEFLNIQNKKQITFLAFLIRAVCPLSLNTNFNIIFTMCLDSIVIQKQKMINQGQNQPQNKVKFVEHSENEEKSHENEGGNKQKQKVVNIKSDIDPSFVTFGHVVRQKTLIELQNILSKSQCFVRKISIINLMTKLFSIKQFSRLCIQTPNFVKNLQQMYVDTLAKVKHDKLPQMTIIAKKLLIPFYINPITILLQVNISGHLQKKQKRKHQRILMRLYRQEVDSQLVPSQFFHSTKFKSNWPYTTISQISNNFFQSHGLQQFQSQSSSSSEDSEYNDESQSQMDQEQFQQFLQQAQMGEQHYLMESEQDPQQIQRERNQILASIEDQDQDNHLDQYTNSWINYDTVQDSLLGINEEDREDDQEQDNPDDGDPNTVTISIYPEGTDQVIEEDQQGQNQYDQQMSGMQGDQLDDEGLDDISESLGEQQIQENEQSPMEQQDPMTVHQQLSESSIDSEHVQPYQVLRQSGDLKSLYRYFNSINHTKREDPRNLIYRTQTQQDQFILLIVNIYTRWRIEIQRSSEKNKIIYQSICLEDENLVEDHDKCLIGLIDDFEVLSYAEFIEFVNYSKFANVQWNLPDGAQDYDDQDKPDQNQQLLFQGPPGVRGRSRNRIMLVPERPDLLNNRRNAIIIRRQNNPDFLRMIAADQNREMQYIIDPSSERPRPRPNIQERNQQAQNAVQEVQDLGQGGGENIGTPISREGPIDQHYLHQHHSHYADGELQDDNFDNSGPEEMQVILSNQQIAAALSTQGFSLETFRQLPEDLQADILQNIHEQARLNEQFRSVENQQMHNYPMAEPNTPVLQPVSSNAHIENRVIQQASSLNNTIGQTGQRGQPQPAQVGPQHSEQYKKHSNHHVKKINKDIIYLLNRDGKNNAKFGDASDQFLQSVFELIYILSQNDFISFPFNLIACLCVNSHNQSKILSNILSILMHGPNYSESSNSVLPKTTLTNNQNEWITNYSKFGYSSISLKLLYILLNLSKSYSISISMLYPQNKVTKNMNINGIEYQLTNNTLLQNLILIVKFQQIKDNLINLEYLLGVIKNVTVIKYNHHVHALVTAKDKDKDREKDKDKEKEKDKPDRSKQASLQLTQENNSILFSLLESDYLKQNAQTISKIIMRLSLDEKNLDNFIHYFKKIIRSLAQKITKSLAESYTKYGSNQMIPHRLSYKDKIYKSYSEPLIVRLMLIFYEIIKSMKKSIKSQQTNAGLLEDFRQILECDQVKQLCQKGCQIIDQNPSSTQIIPKIHQFIDCFFAIFTILADKQDSTKQQKNAIKSAESQLTKKISIKRKFTTNFIDLENLFQKKLCTPQGKAFINANIRNKINSVLKGSRRSKQSLFEIPIILVALETPHLLQFDNKKSLFKAEIKRLKQRKHYGTVQMSLDRKDVFQESYAQVMNRKVEDLKGKLKIEFEGEEGEDVGGLTRQWFQLLSRQMFNPNYALFIPSSTGSTYQPYSKSYVNGDHLNYFKFIGRIMGKALHDGYLLDAFFTPAFYKHLLGLPITYKDMQEQDFQYYKSLKWILQNSPVQDYMQLNFTYEFDNFGQIKTQNLVPNGDKIQLTEQNKIEYVQLISHAKMAKSVAKQYENLLHGFHQFIPAKLVRIFDQKQLEIMISGLPTVDIDDLRNNTDFVNYSKSDQIIIWLFEVLEEFDMSLRTSFLQFVTGTSRVPPEGFKALQGFNGAQKFNIHKYYDTNHLPRSHTCFNQLDLPPYSSKQTLVEKLTLAITQGKEGFGML